MIVVIGEALIDLVADSDGRFAARPGGAGFNTARTIGRLGVTPAFLDRLSGDGFGRVLRSTLAGDGVMLAVPEPAGLPTTLALVDVDVAGVPRYRFYLDGTSAPALEYPALARAVPAGVTALHAGGLALAAEPIATSIDRLIAADLPQGTLLMIDPNCRPEAIADRPAYLARLARMLRRADAVKVSVEDLDYLAPGIPAASAAADTVGAGDAFGGAFLAWWSASGLTRSDLRRSGPVREALQVAARVASLTCTRPGAEPPWLAEVSGWPGRPGGPA